MLSPTGIMKGLGKHREGFFTCVFCFLCAFSAWLPYSASQEFPKRVYVGTRYYNIFLSEPKCEKDDPRGKDCYDGMTYFCEDKLTVCRIEISPRLNEADKRETLLHELEHVAIRYHGLGFDDTQTFTEDDFIEDNAPQLLEILSDPRNDEVRKYLFQEKP